MAGAARPRRVRGAGRRWGGVPAGWGARARASPAPCPAGPPSGRCRAAAGAGASTSSTTSPRPGPGPAPPAAAVAAFEDARVSVGATGQRVPVGVWYPLGADGERVAVQAASYPHAISLAKISRALLGLADRPPTFFDRRITLPSAGGVISGDAVAAAQPVAGSRAVVLCHGYLGSRFDLVDFAEGLARAGFVVVAPEFAEALTNPDVMPAYQRADGGGPPPGTGASRAAILEGTLADLLEGRFGIPRERTALLGHSAGAGTVVQAEGRFAARVPIAGFRVPEDAEGAAALARDPLLVIASEGDSVISLYPKAAGRFGPSEGIAPAVRRLPVDVAEVDGADAAALAGLAAAGPRAAFVKYEGDAAPCHISFLSARSNDAMVETLAPLLPLARLLDVPLLDFDTYQLTRDSDAVLRRLVPAVVGWLNAVVPSSE